MCRLNHSSPTTHSNLTKRTKINKRAAVFVFLSCIYTLIEEMETYFILRGIYCTVYVYCIFYCCTLLPSSGQLGKLQPFIWPKRAQQAFLSLKHWMSLACRGHQNTSETAEWQQSGLGRQTVAISQNMKNMDTDLYVKKMASKRSRGSTITIYLYINFKCFIYF